ncbi:hypothetical protein GSY74_06010 [Sulfurovum sp. bin170]|uniref:hypothetical protein n=1 Tax=Sulfurovum sp. bin170 TaxID=2695268 RepID=UPI0013DF8663|nr:hypothetical protein [Sulfurovum sp. bin170]NEW60832.1 hypothetical protein [Sulfurovum sp. bin170]
MQTIQLEINENYMSAFINIIENLKDEIVQNYTILNQNSSNEMVEEYMLSPKFLSDKKMFNQRFKDIQDGNAVLLSKEVYQDKMSGFIKELEAKYGDS